MRAAFLEVVNDALGSVAVIMSAVVIALTGWTRIDALAGLLIAGLIATRVITIVRSSNRVDGQASPGAANKHVQSALLASLAGVQLALREPARPAAWVDSRPWTDPTPRRDAQRDPRAHRGTAVAFQAPNTRAEYSQTTCSPSSPGGCHNTPTDGGSCVRSLREEKRHCRAGWRTLEVGLE
ncbi:cation transporter [Aestuariimicrobium ganziense]|uniref:cation transporter n=1 Tax=Aestuariimicrobium ganziense TaxID=2773677 RepID=UPI002E27B5D8|nr:cation transporter [Aestuariimicrobium ganziense]